MSGKNNMFVNHISQLNENITISWGDPQGRQTNATPIGSMKGETWSHSRGNVGKYSHPMDPMRYPLNVAIFLPNVGKYFLSGASGYANKHRLTFQHFCAEGTGRDPASNVALHVSTTSDDYIDLQNGSGKKFKYPPGISVWYIYLHHFNCWFLC